MQIQKVIACVVQKGVIRIMQMKMDKKRVHRFDKVATRKLLEAEDEFISELLDSCEVPDAVEGKQIHYRPTMSKMLMQISH